MTKKELKVGDKVQRLYTYEIREKDSGELYAHILDGSKYHLKISEVKNFKRLKQ